MPMPGTTRGRCGGQEYTSHAEPWWGLVTVLPHYLPRANAAACPQLAEHRLFVRPAAVVILGT